MYKSTILILMFNCSYFCIISKCDNQEQKAAIISLPGIDDIIQNVTNFRGRLSKWPQNGLKTKQGVEDPTVIVSLPLVYLFSPKRHKLRPKLVKASSLVERSKSAKPSSKREPNKPVAKHSSRGEPSKPVAKPSSWDKRNKPVKLFFWRESSETVTSSWTEHNEPDNPSWEKRSKPVNISYWKTRSEPVKSPGNRPSTRVHSGRVYSQQAKPSSWEEHIKPAKPSSFEEESKPAKPSAWEERNKPAKYSSWGGRSKTAKPSWRKHSDPDKFSWDGCNQTGKFSSWGGCGQLAKSGRRLIKGGVPESEQNTAPNLNDYVRMMAKTDMFWLNSTAESIKYELNLNIDVSPMVTIMLNNYVKNINRHLGSLKRIYSIRKYNGLEKDLVFINLVDASSKVVFNELKLFWNQIVDTCETYLNPEKINQMSEKIYKNSVQHTKDEFKKLCFTNKICRPFPSFSDHLADLCGEVIKLSDEKLSEFIQTLYGVIKGRTEFYKFIMGEKLSEEFGLKTLRLIKGDIYDVREAVSVLRGLITQRFYPVESSDQTIEEKTKAGRILIHLIDSTFSKEDEEAISLHFDAMKESLQDWAVDFRNDVETILFTSMIYVSDILEKHWDRGTREQTRSVLQLLLKDGSVTVVR